MQYVKIQNLIGPYGQVDWKGLDISQTIPGSQIYTADSTSVVLVTEAPDIPVHPDVIVIDATTYDNEKSTIQQQAIDQNKEIEILKSQNTQMQGDLKAAQDAINMLLGI